jgi:general secretion pathway protein A
MRQLDQRIAVRFDIQALTRAETAQYIAHRMSVAGAAHTVRWSRRALGLIHRHTGGIPRRINLLCDRVLLVAFVRDTHRVSAAVVRQGARELGGGGGGGGWWGGRGGGEPPVADHPNPLVPAGGGTGGSRDEAHALASGPLAAGLRARLIRGACAVHTGVSATGAAF